MHWIQSVKKISRKKKKRTSTFGNEALSELHKKLNAREQLLSTFGGLSHQDREAVLVEMFARVNPTEKLLLFKNSVREILSRDEQRKVGAIKLHE